MHTATTTALYTLGEIRRWGLLSLSQDCQPWLFILIAAVLVIGAYFLGSINFAIFISKSAYKKDIRSFGSGNAGTTNIMRTFGAKAAGIVLLGDIMKSFIAVTLTILVSGIDVAYIAGIAAMLGHCYPIYFGFKGGKGFATAAGMVLAADPIAFLICAAIFFTVVGTTKYVSAGSITAAMFLPLILNMLYRGIGGLTLIIAVCSILLAVIIIVRHKDNIVRLMHGNEKKFSFKKSVPKDSDIKGESEKITENSEENKKNDGENEKNDD